jgi:AraC-like DNA-binding protein
MRDTQIASDRLFHDARTHGALGSAGLDRPIRPRVEVDMVAGEMASVLDALPNVIFFIKDTEGRYTHANLTLVHRLGLKRRDEVIGRCEEELYPETLGSSYAKQDERVLMGETIENELQVQVLPNHAPGWCLTHKRPLRVHGEIRGIVGTSRDIGHTDSPQASLNRLRRVYDYLHEHYSESVRVYALAEMAGVSVTQLDRHFRCMYQLTPQQMLTKLRIESAMRLLRGSDSMAAIGQACGFADQSAFARQFKATVGMTPRGYRAAISAPAVESH